MLGKGQFGTTRLATDKKTGELLACKSISKRKLTTADDIADVQREVQIMHHLAGHPNVSDTNLCVLQLLPSCRQWRKVVACSRGQRCLDQDVFISVLWNT